MEWLFKKIERTKIPCSVKYLSPTLKINPGGSHVPIFMKISSSCPWEPPHQFDTKQLVKIPSSFFDLLFGHWIRSKVQSLKLKTLYKTINMCIKYLFDCSLDPFFINCITVNFERLQHGIYLIRNFIISIIKCLYSEDI